MKAASSVLFVVSPRIYLRILQHRLEGKVVIDALNAFHEGISDDYLCIRAALGSSVAISTTSIGHVTFSFIDV